MLRATFPLNLQCLDMEDLCLFVCFFSVDIQIWS